MTPQSVTYSANGNCATFGFDFPVFEPADLEVLLNGTPQDSGFTLLGAGSPEGGAVRFSAAPAADSAVILRRTGKVQVSGSDTPGFLDAKVVGGAHVTVSKTSDSAGEHLSIATDIDPAAFATAAQGAKADSALQPAVIDTDGTLATNSDSLIPSQKAVKTYVDAKVGTAIADIAIDERNILRQALSSALHGAYEAETLFCGYCDAFNSDTIGTNSSGQSYESGGKYYGNPGTAQDSGYSAAYQGSAGYTTFGRTFALTNGAAVRSIAVHSNTAGSISVKIGYENSSTDIDVVADQTFSHQGTGWETCELVTPYMVPASGTYRLGHHGTNNYSVGPVDVPLSYVLGNASGNSEVYVVSSGSKAPLNRAIYVSPNMTLVSDALSPASSSAPAKVRVLVLWKAIDASTLNTDFTAEATRDGSTWSAGTLVDSGFTLSGFNVLSADIDVSGQPSGTTVKYRLKTHNAKAQQVKGVALLAK